MCSSRRLTQDRTGGCSGAWHASGDGLHHKLEFPAQFTSVKSCPRCEHTLDLAQSVRCSGPQACNGVRHRCLLVLHSGRMGKTGGGRQITYQRPGERPEMSDQAEANY